ncbi:hypothetical protein BC829DRAFT_416772 [Chytridium lagenaria]|nr:hypothetical protein BC829DRAFT_416772 [Chytridium lagenaria]
MGVYKSVRNSVCCIGGRCCCWLFFIFTLLVAAAVAFAIFWVRIPSVSIKEIRPDTTQTTLRIQGLQAFNVSLQVDLSVTNDNFFNLLFDYIDVDAFNPNYDSGNTPIGKGSVGSSSDRLKINSRSVTTFTLPAVLSYDSEKDKNGAYFTYILKQCFGIGDRMLGLDLHIDLGFTIISWTRKAPMIKSSANFKCPF